MAASDWTTHLGRPVEPEVIAMALPPCQRWIGLNRASRPARSPPTALTRPGEEVLGYIPARERLRSPITRSGSMSSAPRRTPTGWRVGLNTATRPPRNPTARAAARVRQVLSAWTSTVGGRPSQASAGGEGVAAATTSPRVCSPARRRLRSPPVNSPRAQRIRVPALTFRRPFLDVNSFIIDYIAHRAEQFVRYGITTARPVISPRATSSTPRQRR